jgi:DNA-binding CsgD family transcriptional regulator
VPSSEEIYRLIDRIYEVVLDPSRWNGLLRDIGKLVNASQGSLLLGSVDKKFATNFGYGRNEEAVALYNTRFLANDPWFETMARLPVGRVATGQEVLPTRRFQRTAYYQECLTLAEIFDCVAFVLEKGRELNAAMAFQRPESLPLFNEEDKKVLSICVPHLQRLVQIQRKFDGLSAMCVLQADVLDRLSFGVAIVNASTGLCFLNCAARAIDAADDGLRFTSKGLLAGSDEANRALATAQKKALAPPAKGAPGPRGRTLTIRRPSMKRPYIVHVVPITAGSPAARPFGPDGAFSLITITDPEKTPTPAGDLLFQAYRLTPMEAALALKIGSGLSLHEAADALSISNETARWHLKKILAKTDAPRQSELVRLLGGMALPLA